MKEYKEYQLRIPFTPEFNNVKGGGWQYILYNSKSTDTKCRFYYLNNLQAMGDGKCRSFVDCGFPNFQNKALTNADQKEVININGDLNGFIDSNTDQQ